MEMSIRFPGPGLVFDYVPRSFQIFGMEFTIYGVLIAVGALLGMGLVTLEAKRNGEVKGWRQPNGGVLICTDIKYRQRNQESVLYIRHCKGQRLSL